MKYFEISLKQLGRPSCCKELNSLYEADEDKREEALDAICKELHLRVGKGMSEYKEEFQKLSYEDFKKIVLPEVESMEAGIRSYQESKGTKSKESVDVALSGYFSEVSARVNPLFGDLTVNLVFKLGKFDSTAEFFSDWFKGMISEQISNSTHKIQKSPHFLIKKATEQIQKRFLEDSEEGTKELKQLLLSEKKNLPREEVEAKLQEEIAKTAKIAHDLVMRKVSDASGAWYKKPIVTKALGSNHKKLSKLISRVYGKVFSNRLMTHNLIIRGQEAVMAALAEGGKKADQASSLHPKKVNKVPTVIPNLFAA
jgi:hypothetical protein